MRVQVQVLSPALEKQAKPLRYRVLRDARCRSCFLYDCATRSRELLPKVARRCYRECYRSGYRRERFDGAGEVEPAGVGLDRHGQFQAGMPHRLHRDARRDAGPREHRPKGVNERMDIDRPTVGVPLGDAGSTAVGIEAPDEAVRNRDDRVAGRLPFDMATQQLDPVGAERDGLLATAMRT